MRDHGDLEGTAEIVVYYVVDDQCKPAPHFRGCVVCLGLNPVVEVLGRESKE